METVEPPAPVSAKPTRLERLRNMWEFANLAQWVSLFGKAVKIDENLDIEVRNRRVPVACERRRRDIKLNSALTCKLGSRDRVS